MDNQHFTETFCNHDAEYKSNIENYLVFRAHTVQVDAKGNLLNLAVLSEDFYVEFLNILLDLTLVNANAAKQNTAGIDLVDWNRRVAVQVSVTCAPNSIHKKIQSSIDKFRKPDGAPWKFYFVPITDKAPNLSKEFHMPDGMTFDKQQDVLDIHRMMTLATGIDKLKSLSELVDKYGKNNPGSPVLSGPAMRDKMWHASKRHFRDFRAPGGRFEALNIIDRLLPLGTTHSANFLARGINTEGDEKPIGELVRKSKNHIAIVGPGGVGKTTYLQQIMEEAFGSEHQPANNHSDVVPFFIELNRCPEHVSAWYDKSLRKTNFITRYIGQILENHLSMDDVSAETIIAVEKELQRSPEKEPQYLLLLDGFNEVNPSAAVRRQLSQEISVLGKYPNVRIITTSRETQGAYYASKFESIHALGVSPGEIIEHLRKNGFHEYEVGEIAHNEPLMQCLRVPLYLCMFAAEGIPPGELLPETAGEILYSFFHKRTRFYNARNRIEEAETVALSGQSIAVITDFIVPYIGWEFEKHNAFYMKKGDFHRTINNAFQETEALVASHASNPFSEYDYQGDELLEALSAFRSPDGCYDTAKAISVIYDSLGIIYLDTINEGPFTDRIRYAFSHHHFRDYFSAIWDVRLLQLLQCISPSAFNKKDGVELNRSLQYYLDNSFWTHGKVQFISEILMEYRNRPYLDKDSLNWRLPATHCDEQRTLANVLDFCRKLVSCGIPSQRLLKNVLAAILLGRKDFSGLDLSCLDLREVSLFGVRCSRMGKSEVLAASFEQSSLSDYCFEPEDHLEPVTEYAYHDNHCFTIDIDGIIKCWDVPSGKLEKTIKSGRISDGSDFATNGFLKISHDGRWLAAKVHQIDDQGNHLEIKLYDLTDLDNAPKLAVPPQNHFLITSFAFSADSQSVFVLCDAKDLYSISIATGQVCHVGQYELYRQCTLFTGPELEDIFVLTAEYSLLDLEDTYRYVPEAEDESPEDYLDDSEDEESVDTIPCKLLKIPAGTGRLQTLCEFIGTFGAAPVVSFSDHDNCFLFYDELDCQIKRFDISTGCVKPILAELVNRQDEAPRFIFPRPSSPGEFFVVYPNKCFVVSADAQPMGSVLLSFPISGARNLIPDAGEDDSFMFSALASPAPNHLIIRNDENTYEWDLENDIIIRKYNTVLYECVGLFRWSQRQQYLLVHAHNGISVFGGNPLRMVFQHCIYEPGYSIQQPVFHEETGVIAICLVRPDHEKVMLLDLITGAERIVFSTLNSSETILDVSFSPNGNSLLITTQYKCTEILVSDDKVESLFVAQAGQNERFAGGHYSEGEVEIVVVEHERHGIPRIAPHCDYYCKAEKEGQTTFICKWSHIIPELNEQDYQFFLHSHNDFGVGCSNDSEGIQSYWITNGFFTNDVPKTCQYYSPPSYAWDAEKKVPIENVSSQRFVYVVHKHELTNRYHIGKGKCAYSIMHLSGDGSQGIITDDGTRLLFLNNPLCVSWNHIEKQFKERFSDVPPSTMWSFAVPCDSDSMLGCYDGFNLMRISAKDNKLLEDVTYYPGVSIYGCSFFGATLTENARDVVVANGGIVTEKNQIS